MNRTVLYSITVGEADQNGYAPISVMERGSKIPIVGTVAKLTPCIVAELCRDLADALTDKMSVFY